MPARRSYPQVRDWRGRPGHRVGDHRLELPAELGDRLAYEQHAVVDPHQVGPVFPDIHGQGEVSGREPAPAGKGGNPHAIERRLVGLRIPHVDADLLVVHHGRGTTGNRCADQQLVRDILVDQDVEDGHLRPPDESAERGITAQVDLGWQHVHEHAYQVLHLGAMPVAGDRKADRHHRFPGVAAEHGAKSGQHDHGYRGAGRFAEAVNGGRDLRWQRAVPYPAAARRTRHALLVCWQ